MKKKTLKNILLALLICITACYTQKSDLYNRLEQIDSVIINKNEAAAMQMYDTLCIDGATDDERAYYNLWTVKLFYHNPYTARFDSIINVTEQYYRSSNDKQKKVQILFYKSSYYFVKDEFYMAEQYLDEAEEEALSLGSCFDLALINWLKISVCAVFNDLDKSKIYSDRQIFYSEQTGSDVQTTYAFLNRAILYRQLNQNDSAYDWFQKVLTRDKWISLEDKSFIYNALGEMLVDSDPHAAEVYFKKSSECSPNPMAECNLARLYFKAQRIDDAKSIALANIDGSWAEMNIDFLNILIQCSLLQGDSITAFNYSQKIVSQKDSIFSRLERARKMEIASSFQIQDDKSSDNWFIFLMVVIGICFCVVLVLVMLYRRHKKEIEMVTTKICSECHFEDNYLKAKAEIADWKDKLAQKERTELILRQQLSEYNKINAEGKCLLQKIVDNEHLSNNDFDNIGMLRVYYGFIKPAFIEDISSKYANLTDQQVLYLILSDMGKSDTEIMTICNLEASSVRSIKSRLRFKVKDKK